MLTLRESVFNALQESADRRGVTVQGLIRAVIVPEWHHEHSTIIVNIPAQDYTSDQDHSARESSRKNVEDRVPTKVIA